MARKTAVITGVTGQDGFYLANLLISNGYRVIGAVRSLERAEVILRGRSLDQVELAQWNVSDQKQLSQVLAAYRPDELYNLAARSSGAGMFDDVAAGADVNGLAVARILDAIRELGLRTRFCQASSREIFGDPRHSPQTEDTLRDPRSPYGAAKLYADSMVRVYRRHHGLFACSAILFNHESPLRDVSFVTRRITHEAARIKLGRSNELRLGNLDSSRDWGFAGDYVRAMWLMLQQAEPEDYVVASGESHTVREFCEAAFNDVGLDYREFVREDASSFRPLESVKLVGDASKAREQLNWRQTVGFRRLVSMMTDADLQALSECANAKAK